MFYKHSSDNKIVTLIVYVDDFILAADNIMELEKLKGVLAKKFEIKNLSWDTSLVWKLQGLEVVYLFLNENIL